MVVLFVKGNLIIGGLEVKFIVCERALLNQSFVFPLITILHDSNVIFRRLEL